MTNTLPRILCVDDEPQILDGLRDVLRRSFDVRVAESGASALELLKRERHAYAVVISDMRMPGMSGAVFLGEAKRVAPTAVRMLLTGYSDSAAAAQAVNDGQIFRFLTKPCDHAELNRACADALWQHRLMSAERVLLERTLHGSIGALTNLLALTSPAVFGHGARLRQAVGRLARAVGRDDAWEIELAALLVHLGAVTLPQETAARLYRGEQLSPNEQALVARLPATSHQMVSGIPGLEGVLEILTSHRRRFDSIDDQGRLPIGARMLKVVIDHSMLAAETADAENAIEAMRSRTGEYDPQLLEAYARTVAPGPRDRMREVALAALEPGTTLADDVRTLADELLAARGSVLTAGLVERLQNLPHGRVPQPLFVLLDVDADKP